MPSNGPGGHSSGSAARSLRSCNDRTKVSPAKQSACQGAERACICCYAMLSPSCICWYAAPVIAQPRLTMKNRVVHSEPGWRSCVSNDE